MKRQWSYPAIQFKEKGCILKNPSVKISVLIVLFCSNFAFGATGTINYNTTYQEIEGFGGAGAYYENWLIVHPNKETIYDILFRDLGLDIYRIRNTYDFDEGDAGYIGRTKQVVEAAKVRNPNLKIMLSSWSPPEYLKSNDSTVGGTLKKEPNGVYMYGPFGDWWADSLTAWENNNVTVDYVNIQNEVDFTTNWDTCFFAPSQTDANAGYDQAFQACYQKIYQRMGPNMPKMLAPEGADLIDVGSYINVLDNNPDDLNHIYGFSHHLYDATYSNPDSSITISRMQNFHNNYGYKPVFQTEYSDGAGNVNFSYAMYTAQFIHNSLVHEYVSSYLYWDLFWGSTHGLVTFTGGFGGSGYTINPVYYAMKHYSYFTDPGWYRIGATTSSSNLRITAFKDQVGESLTIVILNKSTTTGESITLTLNNYPSGTSPLFSQIYRSSETENWAYIGTFNPAEAISLPAQSITTINMSNCPASSSWKTLGSGTNAEIQVLTSYNGSLIAGGNFTTAGGTPANYIARWDGTSWQQLGSGMNSIVYALTVYNGNLIAGGYFTTAGGNPASYIAQWDGSTWQPLGGGMNEVVFALAVYKGDLIAAGFFTLAGETETNLIARWDGSAWHPLGNGLGDVPLAMAVYDGNLIVSGFFNTAGETSANFIALWDGENWQSLGDGMDNVVYALAITDDGLIAGGEFTSAGGSPANYIAQWNGSYWQSLGSGLNNYIYLNDLTVYNRNLIAGGYFTTAGGSAANYIALWNGLEWLPVGTGMNNPVVGLTVYNGELVAGGNFTDAGGTAAEHAARWGLVVNYPGDLNHDCVVDGYDLKWFADRWLDEDCQSAGWCYQADLNYDLSVNFEDFATLGVNWLQGP